MIDAPLTLELLQHGVPVAPGTVLLRTAGAHPPTIGPGTVYRASSAALVAATAGLSLVDPEGAQVYSAEIHRGDVRRGQPLQSAGNLIVMGSVEPGARIIAGGSVGVRGEVKNARIEAMGAVVLLTGCSHSHIQAGANKQALQLSLSKIETIESSLRRLLAVVDQLKAHPKFRTVDLSTSLRPLMQILVEYSFSGFPLQISEAMKRLTLHQHNGRALAGLREVLERRYADGALMDLTQADVEGTHRLAQEAVATLIDLREARNDVIVKYGATSSNMSASGSVEVIEGNCQAYSISAGVAVRVNGTIDGGAVVAHERVEAERVCGGGSVEVEGPGHIRAGEVFSGTLVRVGHVSTRTTTTVSPAHFQLSQGRLVSLPEVYGT